MLPEVLTHRAAHCTLTRHAEAMMAAVADAAGGVPRRRFLNPGSRSTVGKAIAAHGQGIDTLQGVPGLLALKLPSGVTEDGLPDQERSDLVIFPRMPLRHEVQAVRRIVPETGRDRAEIVGGNAVGLRMVGKRNRFDEIWRPGLVRDGQAWL
jgi:hypothetical protein